MRVNFASCKPLEYSDRLDLLRLKTESVDIQKGTNGQKRYALVAIDEGVIPGQTKGVFRGQGERVRILPIRKEMFWTGKCTFQQTGIAQPGASSEESE